MILGTTSDRWPILSTSSRNLELLRTARPGHGLHMLLVSRAAQAMRAHAERCRDHPVYGSWDRWSGTECPDLRGSPQIYAAGFRHGFEILTPLANFPPQGFNF